MSAIWISFILAASAAAPMDAGDTPAVAVFQCDFGESWDRNYDGWPDRWTRLSGKEYPPYVKMAIQRGQANPGEGSLRVELNGGGAAAHSPLVEVSPLFSYALEGRIKTFGLEHDEVYLEVALLDAAGQRLETHRSQRYRGADEWTRVQLGPLAPAHADVRAAVIGLYVIPTDQADLSGEVLFDDIWLGRFPRMTLQTNSEHNVYNQGGHIEITCRVSGLTDPNPRMECEVLDQLDRQLAVLERPLNQLSGETPLGLFETVALPAEGEPGAVGVVRWKPRLEDVGFFRLRIRVQDASGAPLEQTVQLAVIHPQRPSTAGRFGWSLPPGEHPLPLSALVSLLSQVGVQWAKFPVWYGADETEWADRVAWFAERLSNHGVTMVGVLDQPPEPVRELFGDQRRLSAASAFLEPELWQPLVDPVMIRLSVKVRWWQLGGDDDASFVDLPSLEQKIKDVRRHLEQFGQRIRLGIGWRWMNEPPSGSQAPWDYLSMMVDPPFTGGELGDHLQLNPPGNGATWLVLKPLPRARYDLATRARDLAARMIEASVHDVQGVFIAEPFHDEHGLMTASGEPSELLLPWRTTALMLAGAEYLGSLRLPQGSSNRVFARDGEAVMAIWNDTPVVETIYLGEDVRQVNLWGHGATPRQTTEQGCVRQEIEVGPTPTFITGVHPAIARWRMSLQFDNTQLSNVFGQSQLASYRFQNSFDKGVRGTIELIAPDVWDVQQRVTPFSLAGGEQQHQSFRVLLGSDANSGPQPVRIDFDVNADRHYRFSVYREIQVGSDAIAIELRTRLSDTGELLVEQYLINETDSPVSFNCLLFAPGRRRQRLQIVDAGRGRSHHQYVLPEGEKLLGRTLWLRAEEMGGARILNYRVVAAP